MTKASELSRGLAGLHELDPSRYANLAGLVDTCGERDWFAEGAIEGNAIVVWAAPEKSGKSWILGDLAVATAIGGKWLHRFEVKYPGRVLVLETENLPHETARRLSRLARARGAEPHEVLSQIDYYRLDVALDDPQAVEEMCRDFRRDFQRFEKPELVIIDPLREHLEGNEDSAKDVVRAMMGAKMLRGVCDAPVIIAHHLNKSGKMSGSRAIRTSADLIVEGTDADVPRYSAVGRRIRTGDLIGQPFTVDISHEHDEDDSHARTICRARFASERTAPAAELGATARKVLDLLSASPRGLTVRELRDKAGSMNNGTWTQTRDQLVAKGLIVQRDRRWFLATAPVLRGVSQRGDSPRPIPTPTESPQ